MKRTFIIGAAAGLLIWAPHEAHAQWIVADPVQHILSQLGLVDQATQIAKAVAQLEQLQQSYQMLMSQYQAIAHIPQEVTGIASGLTTTPTLQNPLPGIGQLQGLVNGITPPSGYGSQYLQTNTYYTPNSTDPGAQELIRRQQATAGIQGMATDALHSLEQRSTALKEFLGSIGGSPDIQQTEAVNARLQLEQNYVAGQQAQAANLMTLATAQQAVTQNRAEEIAQKDAAAWQAKTESSWSMGQ